MVLVLGIESSCDDACAAVVRDGHEVLAEVTASQAEAMSAWGGVVPELAARGHLDAFPGVVVEALARSGVAIDEVDGIAVTAFPGLGGSLLAGITCAKVLAARRRIPLLAVDHIAAHLAAVHLGRVEVSYPFLGLVASGGHSHYYLARGPGDLDLLGGTIDDAAGEAFDKAAAMLGLGYPGGPLIDALAAQGDPRAFILPRSLLDEDSARLSFSGLKTALLYRLKGSQGHAATMLDARGLADACASFQAAVVDVLAIKLLRLAAVHGLETIAIGGGVACNRGLRTRLADECAKRGLRLLAPEPRHCADNAAMVAALGTHLLAAGRIAGHDLVPLPSSRAGPRARRHDP